MSFYLLWVIFLTSCVANADQSLKVKSFTSQQLSAGLYSKNVSRLVAVPQDEDDDGIDDDDLGIFEEGSGDTSLEKITDAEVSGVEDEEDASVDMTSKKEDDIAFDDDEDYGDDADDEEEDNDEDVNVVNMESEGKSPVESATMETDEKNKDEFLGEYYNGDFDDDVENMNGTRPVVPPVKFPNDETATADSSVTFVINGNEDTSKEVSTTFLMLLIAGSAVITFMALLLAFFIYSRALKNNRKQKLQSFSVPPEACVLTSASVWSSPIAKTYQQVSTSTEKILNRHQSQVTKNSETMFPLLP